MTLNVIKKISFCCMCIVAFGCTSLVNPDDGLKLRMDLNDVTLSQLKKFKYKEMIEGSGAYGAGIKDTSMIYCFNKGKITRRFAMFKYKGDTSAIGLEKQLKTIGFTVIKNINQGNNWRYIVKDEKYKRTYFVALGNRRWLQFCYPDTLVEADK